MRNLADPSPGRGARGSCCCTRFGNGHLTRGGARLTSFLDPWGGARPSSSGPFQAVAGPDPRIGLRGGCSASGPASRCRRSSTCRRRPPTSSSPCDRRGARVRSEGLRAAVFPLRASSPTGPACAPRGPRRASLDRRADRRFGVTGPDPLPGDPQRLRWFARPWRPLHPAFRCRSSPTARASLNRDAGRDGAAVETWPAGGSGAPCAPVAPIAPALRRRGGLRENRHDGAVSAAPEGGS